MQFLEFCIRFLRENSYATVSACCTAELSLSWASRYDQLQLRSLWTLFKLQIFKHWIPLTLHDENKFEMYEYPSVYQNSNSLVQILRLLKKDLSNFLILKNRSMLVRSNLMSNFSLIITGLLFSFNLGYSDFQNEENIRYNQHLRKIKTKLSYT